ncbi:ion channel [Streptomyces sp. NPDC004647]|uniref:potassium channel family protein n=1 Tax=Streptomyces sp. NPDC004647 TaxID=3154671 RepID=UPI0033B30EBD
MSNDGRMQSWEDRTEIPLTLVSLLFLASYAVRVLDPGLSPQWQDFWLAVTLASWACFAVDYAVLFILSGQGLRFIKHHGLDTLVLVLPLLRPLRMVRVFNAVQKRRAEPTLTVQARVILYASLTAVLLGFAASLAVYQSERGAPGATIRTFGDAVWWCCSTLSTVGYGDVAPVTARGRVVAAGLMACGLALLGAVAGSFSSWLVQAFTREDEKVPPE